MDPVPGLRPPREPGPDVLSAAEPTPLSPTMTDHPLDRRPTPLHGSSRGLALVLASALGGGLMAACGGGGGGGGAPGTDFELLQVSVSEGSVWQINREIVMSFNQPVDFGSINSNTISVLSSTGVPGTGIYRLRDPLTVVFQPTCPTQQDLSDAGLLPGSVSYTLSVKGLSSHASQTVESLEGRKLRTTQIRHFVTPASTLASIVFQDTAQGPPEPVLREQGSAQTAATYLELGNDPDRRVYFELDPNDQVVLSDPTFEAPLNLYSDADSAVGLVIEFNQPVNPSDANISSDRLRLEYRDGGGNWNRIDTRVTLAQNCTETGARVRLEPIGVLPPSSAIRGLVLPGFQDLVGQTNLQTRDDFAQAPTKAVSFSSLNPPDELSDELKEDFTLGGDGPRSFQDINAVFDTPEAEWGGGKLSAAFSFDGTGGPGGDFDWVVRSGQLLFFDTSNTAIVGGPGGIPTTTQVAVNGVVDLRNFIIEEGGEVRVQGVNPMRINATGDIIIRGRLDLGGFNAKDVATLNTGNQVEIGGAGAAAGGRGGSASQNTSGSTPRGGPGDGPFRQPGLGGEGGETGYNPASGQPGKDQRRPGGGGGGRFAADWVDTDQASTCSVAAGPGTDGHQNSFGADPNDGHRPARGGRPGQGPFQDPSAENDFFGTRPVVEGGQLTRLIRGELTQLWGGYGGGGGGNADPFAVFPSPNWNFGSDEKGGGGGGAAGGLHIKALGKIILGRNGQILANGGKGGTGENTNFLDHVGGTGGGGSGGHVVLESATVVDFTDGGANVSSNLGEFILACGPELKKGPLADVNNCCKGMSNGGPGGPGVIQIHVPDAISPPGTDPASTDIVVTSQALTTPNPLDRMTSPPAYVMIPTFGARSKVRSRWISIGGADEKPSGSEGLVRFLFAGVNPVPGPNEGKILTQGASVLERPALTFGLLEGVTDAVIAPDRLTLILTGNPLNRIRNTSTAGVSNDIYLRTPSLFEDFTLRVSLAESPAVQQNFPVVSAVYDEKTPTLGDEELRLTVAPRGQQTLKSFLDQIANDGTAGFELIPRFFTVQTEGVDDVMPTTAFVRILFQATDDNGSGAPDEQNLLVDWTGDISKFNALPAGQIQYFRYEVEFDLDAAAQGVSADTTPISLDFLRVPFVF